VLIPIIRGRLLLATSAHTHRSMPSKAHFGICFFAVLLQGLAAFLPGTYLPGESYNPATLISAYASALYLPSVTCTLSIALMNLARVPGQALIGYASDRIGPRKLVLAMAVVSTVSVFAGWGTATTTGGILGFSLLFWGFAGRKA